MPESDLTNSIQAVMRQFEKLGINHAITGSFASSVHGEPVTSVDVDFVVRMTPEQAMTLAQALAPRFYADPDSLRQAAENRSITNVVDNNNAVSYRG